MVGQMIMGARPGGIAATNACVPASIARAGHQPERTVGGSGVGDVAELRYGQNNRRPNDDCLDVHRYPVPRGPVGHGSSSASTLLPPRPHGPWQGKQHIVMPVNAPQPMRPTAV